MVRTRRHSVFNLFSSSATLALTWFRTPCSYSAQPNTSHRHPECLRCQLQVLHAWISSKNGNTDIWSKTKKVMVCQTSALKPTLLQTTGRFQSSRRCTIFTEAYHQDPCCTAQVSRTAELKEVNTGYAGQKTRSLPLSDCLIAEIKHNRGVYLTIMLVTEASLSFRAVEYTSWKLLSNAMPSFSLIRSRNTIPEKLKQHSGYFRRLSWAIPYLKLLAG